MLQINNLSVQALTEKKFITFMRFTYQAVLADEYVSSEAAFYVNRFIASYQHLDEVYLKYDVDACTKAVQEADQNRDIKFRKMRDMIKMFITYPEDAEKMQAAEELMRVVELYGGADITQEGVNDKTASIANLVDDFELRYMPQVEALGLGDALAALKAAQELYDEKYNARDLCESQIDKNAMADARTRMTDDYRLLVSVINNMKYEDTEGQLDAFIRYMNVEIGRFRTYTGQGQVGSTTKPKPEEDEDSEADGNVMLTFEKANESIVTLTGKPGESYEIPPLEPDYIWVKKEGEPLAPNGIFPDEDMTFIEVPVGEMKSAGFHFTNGKHETFYGLPGTEYIIPLSSEGYYWQPQPTGKIPQVDTQYFETLVPELDERPKYRLTFRAEGRVVAIQEYYEGETIVPPECPEGFEWPDDLPEVMPARNLVIVGVEIND